MAVEVIRSENLSPTMHREIRALMDAAFEGDFADQDWEHTLGGWHVTASDAGVLVSHAAVVERTLWVGERAIRTGYVEGVGTDPARDGQGFGSTVMSRIREIIEPEFELGALATSRCSFYERLGWERWQGPSFVRRGANLVRTPEEDDGIMVLRFGPTADLDRTLPIACEERSGDDW